MKYRQTILMALSLIIVISFFIPWFTINSEFDMFASSESGFSGFTLIRGIHYAAPMVRAFGNAYGFPFAASAIYLGYLLVLIPILGIAAMIMSGMRKPSSKWVHLAQFVLMFVVIILLIVAVNLNRDMRQLYSSVLRLSFGLPIALLASLAGLGYTFFNNKKE
ncbi:MAG: hypothetical protein IBX70_01590 [Clostridia bacterium]|nr:hypothetical protein [Clostridia bacterium]